jgi:hypothetical protein
MRMRHIIINFCRVLIFKLDAISSYKNIISTINKYNFFIPERYRHKTLKYFFFISYEKILKASGVNNKIIMQIPIHPPLT